MRGRCGTYPTRQRSRRSRRRRRRTRSPCPACGASSPSRIRSNVDFPEPFGPGERGELAGAHREAHVVEHRARRRRRTTRRRPPARHGPGAGLRSRVEHDSHYGRSVRRGHHGRARMQAMAQRPRAHAPRPRRGTTTRDALQPHRRPQRGPALGRPRRSPSTFVVVEAVTAFVDRLAGPALRRRPHAHRRRGHRPRPRRHRGGQPGARTRASRTFGLFRLEILASLRERGADRSRWRATCWSKRSCVWSTATADVEAGPDARGRDRRAWW